MTVTAPTPPQPWSIPSGATYSQTIVQLQTDRPLAVVTCTSGKVSVSFSDEISPGGIHSVVLEADGNNYDLAMSCAAVVTITPMPSTKPNKSSPDTSATGNVALYPHIPPAPDQPISAPWTLINGATSKQLLLLDDHINVNITSTRGAVSASFTNDTVPGGVTTIQINSGSSSTGKAHVIYLNPVDKSAFGTMTLSK